MNNTAKLHLYIRRLLEVMTHRIVDIHPPDKPVAELFSQKMYRVEVQRFIFCYIYKDL